MHPLYWRLSGFYFFYFASLGALIPYWGLYLKTLGFGAVEIGELVAIIMATKIVAPNIWGWIADRSGRRMQVVRLACLLATLAFAGVFLWKGYWWLALVMTVFSFFWNAALPQFEATTMNHLGDDLHRYSGIRLWGSIGFILAVSGLGTVLGITGTGILPAVLLGLFVLIWLSSLAVPESAAGHLPLVQEPLRQVLGRRVVVSLLLVCFLVQASHGPYYAFFSIYMERFGYSTTLIGQLWALGVFAEIIIFMLVPMLLPRFGARTLLLAAIVLTTLRWLLTALFPDRLGVMIFSQTLHAASFGLYHAVMIALIHSLFVGAHQGRGQALYSSISFGAGGAVGALLSGYLWTDMGPRAMFLVAAVTSLAALLVVHFGMRNIPET